MGHKSGVRFLPGLGALAILRRFTGVPAKGPVLGSQERSEKRKIERTYLRFLSIGVQFGLTLTILVLGGVWLDEKLDISPLFTVIGALIGVVGGMASVIYRVLGSNRK